MAHRRAGLFGLCCILVAACSGVLEAGPAVFVQISDIHLNKFAAEHWAEFGDKEGDLKLLASSVLAAIKPGAILLTGDLVDAKTLYGQGHQYEVDWLAYRRVLDALVQGTGLPETSLLDIRGNHDDFDVPERAGPGDRFPVYAAAGRRNATTRVFMHPLFAPHDKKCPDVLLFGFDATPNPGLRGPTNFLGLMTDALLAEIDATLTRTKAEYRAKGCNPSVVSYGHHPLSTITHYDQHPWAARAPHIAMNGAIHVSGLPADSAQNTHTIHSVLGKHGVLAYLNGHLHGAFGEKLHRMHPVVNGGHLAELETAAWKDDRRFRVMTLDNGVFAFSDLMFSTPSKPASPQAPAPSHHLHTIDTTRFSIGALDPTQHVRNHIVVMTSPPDGRYSPLLAAPDAANAPDGGPRVFDEIHAIVLPVDQKGQAAAQKVYAQWRCADSSANGTVSMQPARQQAQHAQYSAKWPAQKGSLCGPQLPASGSSQQPSGPQKVYLNIVVEDSEGLQSTSGSKPVALRTDQSGSQRLSEPDQPFPLDLTLIERLVLSGDWSKLGYRLFNGAWLAWFVGMLMLPKLCGQLFLQCVGDRSRVGLLSWVLWPAVALCDMASMFSVWMPQVLYSLYMLQGPWFVARFLSDRPPGLFFAGSVVVNSSQNWRPLSRWRLMASPDSTVFAAIHLIGTVLPLTLWVACVVSRWQHIGLGPAASRRQSSGKPGGAAVVSLLQGLSGVLIVAWHLRVVWRIPIVCYGWLAALLSPGVAWLTPLLIALLWHAFLCATAISTNIGSPKRE